MPTNEERREVAARLRDIGVNTLNISWHELYAIKNACGCCIGQDQQDVELKDRLADLIEPEPERTCKYIWDADRHVWFCSECGGLEPCSDSVNYCCDCGAKVVE